MSLSVLLTSCQSKKTVLFFLPKTLGCILQVPLKRTRCRLPAEQNRLAGFSGKPGWAMETERKNTRRRGALPSRSEGFHGPTYGRVAKTRRVTARHLGEADPEDEGNESLPCNKFSYRETSACWAPGRKGGAAVGEGGPAAEAAHDTDSLGNERLKATAHT